MERLLTKLHDTTLECVAVDSDFLRLQQKDENIQEYIQHFQYAQIQKVIFRTSFADCFGPDVFLKILENLHRMPKLKTVEFDRIRLMPVREFRIFLQKTTQLKRLIVKYAWLELPEDHQLQNLRELEWQGFTNFHVQGNIDGFFQKLHSIRKIVFSNLSGVNSPASLPLSLTSIPISIRELQMTQYQLSDEYAQQLVEVMQRSPHLKTLALSCVMTTKALQAVLAASKRLTILNLVGTEGRPGRRHPPQVFQDYLTLLQHDIEYGTHHVWVQSQHVEEAPKTWQLIHKYLRLNRSEWRRKTLPERTLLPYLLQKFNDNPTCIFQILRNNI